MNHELKTYQRESLQHLQDFFDRAAQVGAAQAFAELATPMYNPHTGQMAVPPYQARFGDEIICVCLRVPTGGGKTLMAAHAVALAARSVRHTEAPVALWLTPSDTIRRQTLEALNKPQHPYRLALAHYFGDRVRVCDLDTLHTLSPGDVGQTATIIVSTIQALSVRQTQTRNVYSFDEALSPHFASLSPQQAHGLDVVAPEDLLPDAVLTQADVGRVKHSVANWLRLQKPLVIMDEAHRHQTPVFYQTMGRIAPACVIEFTATPVDKINVLHHVSASELKAEQMIKMPVVLTEHQMDWRQCLHDARLTRDRLELLAQQEPDHLRPIMLIQAEDRNGQATVEAVRQYLTEQELIPAPQIAVATGQQKELDGVNLFDPGCPVRYVITVEALKEGWDCSFAYVLAGLHSVESAKDVEQLLGRVLRMPYARRRTQEALNKSYAHVVARSFAQAASRLKDRMVQNMGFDPMDAGALFAPPQLTIQLPDGSTRMQPKVPDLALELNGADCAQVIQTLPPEVAAAVQVLPTSTGATLLLSGGVPRATVVLACQHLVEAVPTAQKAEVAQQLNDHLALIDQCFAPSELGRPFAAVPQLCLNLGDQLTVVDKTLLGSLGRMDLLAEKVQLAQFELQARGLTSEIDVDAMSKGARLTHTLTSTTQQGLDLAHLQTLSENDLMRWLDKELGQHDIKQPDLQKWLLLVLGHLQEERHFTLPELVRSRYRLVPAMLAEIERLRQRAVAKGFQASLPGMVTAEVSQGSGYDFQYHPGIYPAKNLYRGSFVFKKHYYGNGLIHDLQEKNTKGLTEEFICAQAIDIHPLVLHWVRNIERQEKFSFWLPTSDDHFYPDFVAELTDGRLFVVEYKGEHLVSADDAKEKNAVGQHWEAASKGRGLFLMVTQVDGAGRNVAGQIGHKLATH